MGGETVMAQEQVASTHTETHKQQIGAQIAARDAERMERKQERLVDAVPEEDVHGFHTVFTEKMTGLQEQLSSILQAHEEGVDSKILEGRLLELKEELQLVTEFVNAGCLHLPPFDQRTMQLKMKKFGEERNVKHSRIVPRKKFGFKGEKKKKPAGANLEAAEGGSRHSDAVVAAPSVSLRDAIASKVEYDPARSLIGRQDETIVMDKATLAGGDVFIKQCRNCVIFLEGSMGALRAEEIAQCVVMTGPITGGCHMEGAVDCVLHLASHQMRLHHSKGCDFYLQMRSHPIIEDCTTLRFAPYTLDYLGLAEQLVAADLSTEACADVWSQVQDFKWLRQQQSPNWCILPEAERVVPAPP